MNLRTEIFHSPYWLQTCDRLKYCADILIRDLMKEKDFSKRKADSVLFDMKLRALLETNLLLLGYALENGIKALLISNFIKDNSVPENADLKFLKTVVWKNCHDHNLSQLAKVSNLNLNSDELNLLVKLKKYIQWKGRYHLPSKQEEIADLINPGIGDTHTSNDQFLAEQIIDKIKQQIKSNRS
jgi:hypothetical protein